MTDPQSTPPLIVGTDAPAVRRVYRNTIALTSVLAVLTGAGAIALGIVMAQSSMWTGLLAAALILLLTGYSVFATLHLIRTARTRAALGSVLTLDASGMEWRMLQGTVFVPWQTIASISSRTRLRHRVLTYRLADGVTGETPGVRSTLSPKHHRMISRLGLQIGSAGIDVSIDTIIGATIAFTDGRLDLDPPWTPPSRSNVSPRNGFDEPVGPAPRHNDPERVIPTIEAELRPLVRELLGAGFVVIEAWGPAQMACVGLLLERDGTQVHFDAERGMTAVDLIRDGRSVWLGVALAAWARCSPATGEANAVEVNAADLVPWSLIGLLTWETREYRRHGLEQQARYGLAVCDWFPHADLGAIDAVEAEKRALDTRSRSVAPQTPAETAEMVAARYADALDRYVAGQTAGLGPE